MRPLCWYELVLSSAFFPILSHRLSYLDTCLECRRVEMQGKDVSWSFSFGTLVRNEPTFFNLTPHRVVSFLGRTVWPQSTVKETSPPPPPSFSSNAPQHAGFAGFVRPWTSREVPLPENIFCRPFFSASPPFSFVLATLLQLPSHNGVKSNPFNWIGDSLRTLLAYCRVSLVYSPLSGRLFLAPRTRGPKF